MCNGDQAREFKQTHSAIGLPRPLTELPLIVEDPACKTSNVLFLLADMGDHRYLAHRGGILGAKSIYNYNKDGICLVTLKDPVPVIGLKSYPSCLDDVHGDSPQHNGLHIVVALAKCLAEIYSSRVCERQADFSKYIDADPCAWPSTAWNRRLIFIWQCANGTCHATIGPSTYRLLRDCHDTKGQVLSERP